MTNERLIKKYANRRLYDAALSRHVTLADIRQFITAGQSVRVVEDKTGEDITRSILLQVLAEQEQFGKPILSVALLESMIRFYANDLQELAAAFLEASLDAFGQSRTGRPSALKPLFPTAPLGVFGEMARQNFAALAELQTNLARGYAGRADRPPAGDTPPDDED